MMFGQLFKSQWLILLAILPILLMQSFASAEEMPEPQAFVKDASDRMLQALKDNEDKIEEDPAFVYALVDDTFLVLYLISAFAS